MPDLAKLQADRPSNPPSGLFSGFLRYATRRFQRRGSLQVDGIVNPDGWPFGAVAAFVQSIKA